MSNSLKHIEINIWKACNNRCVFCMSKNVPKEMLKLAEFNYLKSRIDYYREQWYNSIWFLWGDISIHPKIIDIIKYSKIKWFDYINVITNGMLFDNYNFAKEILIAWTTRVNISIHSHINEIEDNITRVKWWLQRKLKSIDNFNYLYKDWILKSILSINIVVNKLNYQTIVETVYFYFKIKKINDIRINFVWLSDWVKDDWEKISISYWEFLPYLKKLIYISLKYNIRLTFDAIPPCIFYKIDNKNYDIIIKKFLWEQFDIIDQIEHANIKDEREKFKWKDKKKNILKIKPKGCITCKYYYTCEWIWKEYQTIYWFKEIKSIC